MLLHKTPHPLTSGVDISTRTFWAQTFEERDESFARLREDAPVSWHPPLEVEGLPPEVHGEEGFWAVVRASDISEVSLDNVRFSSEIGNTSLRPRPPGSVGGASFLDWDPPRHTEFRKAVSKAFTPKAVARLSEQIEQRADEIVSRVAGMGSFDFVSEVSSKLPMLTVADLVGVPAEQAEEFAEAGNDILLAMNPEDVPEGISQLELSQRALGQLAAISLELAERRRADPRDDVMTALVNATIDGQPLGVPEIIEFMVLLAVAGNDTTKQTTTRTVMQLEAHPEQKQWLMEDFDGRIVGAIDEFVRHASPVMQFTRTATVDLELGGHDIAAGDKVALFYCSGNRDDRLFENPAAFDITRERNPHLSFGGGGVHYCLGNGVAKAQLRALFRNILTKLPRLEVGVPEYLKGDFINGVKRLPVTTV